MTVFGRILSASTLEQETITVLQKWFPTYLREVESQLSLEVGELVSPQNYTTRNKFDSTAGELLPKVVALSPGLLGPPIKSGTGQYRATWRLGVGIAIAATTEEIANDYAKAYAAAARAIMLQQAGDELDARVEWIDENFSDMPTTDQIQQYRAAAIWFAVEVDDVTSKRNGPLEPDAAPYAYGQVEEVEITVNKDDL